MVVSFIVIGKFEIINSSLEILRLRCLYNGQFKMSNRQLEMLNWKSVENSEISRFENYQHRYDNWIHKSWWDHQVKLNRRRKARGSGQYPMGHPQLVGVTWMSIKQRRMRRNLMSKRTRIVPRKPREKRMSMRIWRRRRWMIKSRLRKGLWIWQLKDHLVSLQRIVSTEWWSPKPNYRGLRGEREEKKWRHLL